MFIESEMPSALKPPDPKKQLSARVRGSILAKAKAVAALWAERVRASGDEEAASQIDVTYVVDSLLGKALDDELVHWGGFPSTDAKMAAALKQARDLGKQ